MSFLFFGAITASLAAKGVIIVVNANCCNQESGMKPVLIFGQVLSAISICQAQALTPQARGEAEYYVAAYAQYYRVPVALVRAIVEREVELAPVPGLI